MITMRILMSFLSACILLSGIAQAYTLRSGERQSVHDTRPKVLTAIDHNNMDLTSFVEKIEQYFGATNLHEIKRAYLDEFIALAEDEREQRRVADFGFYGDIVVTDDDTNIYVATNGLPVNHAVDMEESCDDRNTDGKPDKPYEVLEHELLYTFPKNPELANRPYEIDKEIGIAVNGGLLYRAKNEK